jgi:sphinganine-1-phosphate aldolase
VSRAGSIIAGAYAVMMHMGDESVNKPCRSASRLLIVFLFGSGYARTCEQIVGAARRLKTALRQDFAEDLYVLGDPLVSVVAFSSKTLNIYIVGDMMSKRGWHLNALANPSALHLAVTVSEVVTVNENQAERIFVACCSCSR